MIWIIYVSVMVGLSRFLIPGHNLSWAGAVEALAHIWIGALLVFCFQHDPANRPSRRTLGWWSLGMLAILETVMFLLFKRSQT